MKFAAISRRWRAAMGAATVAATALLAVTAAQATVVIKMSDAQLAHDADVIVHGRVTSQWTVREGGEIHTYTQIEVLRWLKGAGESAITLRQIGGTTEDGITQLVYGDARFTGGQEVVLFLRAGEGLYFLTGLAQSRFIVREDAQLGPVVSRPFDGLSLAELDGKGGMHIIKPGEAAPAQPPAPGAKLRFLGPERLGDFLRRIEKVLREPAPAMPTGYIPPAKLVTPQVVNPAPTGGAAH